MIKALQQIPISKNISSKEALAAHKSRTPCWQDGQLALLQSPRLINILSADTPVLSAEGTSDLNTHL